MDRLLAGDLSEWQRRRVTGLRLLALGRTNLDVAEVVGKHPNTVAKWRSSYLARGLESIMRRPGGRRHQLMDEEAEREFVASFARAAERGELVTASVILQALADETDSAPWPSTVYTMLKRHGWRKIAPRPSHPEASAERREAFKQTSQAWLPPSVPRPVCR